MEMLAPGMGQAATFQWGSIHPVFLAEEQQSHQGWDTGGGWNGQVAMPLPWLPSAWAYNYKYHSHLNSQNQKKQKH